MARDTKEQLIQAALRLFAEKGFESARVQDIADRAGANIAAINYHFGDKASFYATVITRYLDQESGEAPVLAGLEDDPAACLRTYIRWFVSRVGGSASQAPLQHIKMHEQNRPSPVLERLVETAFRPEHERMARIMRALLPPDSTPDTVRRFVLTAVSQCVVYLHAQPVLLRLYPDLTLDAAELDAIAEHVTSVCLAGVDAEWTRRGLEARTSAAKGRSS